MLTALVCGLSLTNQHTAIFLVLPVAITVLAAGHFAGVSTRGLQRVLTGLCSSLLILFCGALGLSPYLYLPIAAKRGALISWGDCSTIKGFIRHITRAEYGAQLWCPFGGDVYCLSLQLFANQRFDSDFLRSACSSILASGWAWALDFHKHSSYLGFPLMTTALLTLLADLFFRQRNPPLPLPPPRWERVGKEAACDRGGEGAEGCGGASSVGVSGGEGVVGGGGEGGVCSLHTVDCVVWGGLALYLGVFHALASIPADVDVALYREVHSRFWQLPNLLASFLAGHGFACIARELEKYSPTEERGEGGRLVVVVIVWVVLVVKGLQMCDFHDLSPFRALAEEVLGSLPRNALLLTQGDLMTNTVRYLWAVEARRRDVTVIDQHLLTAVWFTRTHVLDGVVFPHRYGR